MNPGAGAQVIQSVICLLLAGVLHQERLPSHIDDRNFKMAIKVTLDGELIKFPDTQPMMVANSILVPMRGVFENMGADLKWDQGTSTVTAMRGDHTVQLVLGKNRAQVDGKEVALDQPAISVKGRTMVPLRFLGQSLGVGVDWLKADRTVALTTK